ncbi:MAG: beta-propeller fold lactonase family protein, partial [Anaerolineales bacterium]|nr:beta-propeller fold lactonase family protein [Anaerolineales bacterium]
PGPLDFGNALSSAPSTMIVAIKETGNLPLTVNASLSGPNAGDFALLSANPLTVLNGAPDGELQLSCDPANDTPGPRTATLTLITNDQDHLQVTFDMVCNVPAVPTASFDSEPIAPGPFDFGEVITGQSKNLPLQLIESGNAELVVGPATISGAHAADFAVNLLNGSTVSIFDNDAPVNMMVTCTPSGTGLRTAVLAIATNDPTKATVHYNLVCEGIVLPPPFLHVPGTAVAANGSNPNGLAVSPDGNHVYTVNYGNDTITVYERNNNNGLDFKTVYQNNSNSIIHMDGPSYLAVSPDGRNVYVAAYNSDAVVIFTRDTDSGELTFLGSVQEGHGYNCPFIGPCANQIDGLDGAHTVVVSPDGQHVYISGDLDDALVVLSRNADTGDLRTFFTGVNHVATYKGTNYLDGARGMAISADGLSLYLAALQSDKIAVFKRDGATGTLTLEQEVTEGDLIGINPIKFLDGLDGIFQITVSPDGKHVYATGQNDDSIVAFSRNGLNGRLSYLHKYTDGVDGLTGLDRVMCITMSHDGRYVYASSYNDGALNVFYRLASTGELQLIQEITQAELTNPLGVGVSPDDKVVYVASNTSNNTLVYQPSNPVAVVDALLPASAA